MAEVLNTDEVRMALGALRDWTGDATALRRSVELRGFPEAIAVVARVARVAEAMDHHPDIDIRWRTLTFRCATHSAGGVTERDLTLARRIDEIIAEQG